METVGELLKVIRKNTDTDFVKVSGTPKRCVLNEVYDLVNVPGYFVEFWYPDYDYGDSIFISDIENPMYFHNAPSLFTTELDSFHLPTCVWLTRWSDKELEVDMEIGFFI